MKRLLILTVLSALTGASLGCSCCGLGGCCGRRSECPPYGDAGNPCETCPPGTMGAPTYGTPAPVYTPGPAYNTGYLPR